MATVDEDLDNLDLTSCKDRISALQADRERRLEATERLQEKLKALNNELAARRLEAEQRRMELKEEQNRNKKRAEAQREEGELALVENQREEDRQKVRNFTEEMLQDKASGPNKKDKKLSSYGFRIFDETELMVEKAYEKEGKEQPVDTVLVTHQKPNSDDVRYHLSYRVAKDTPSKKLREDACNYWNLSEVEYILLTVEHSKVHDDVILQHCFKPNECCQLILAPKDPRRQVLTDKEKEATAQKIGKKKSKDKQVKANPEEASRRINMAGNFIEWMQTKPGIWNFMMQRDQNVIDHVTRITCRSICIYALYLILCMVILHYVKPSNEAYYMRQGPLIAMTSPAVDMATGDKAPAYDTIRTQEDAWKWLTYTVSSQLMTETGDLRVHNYLVGWVRIRMQQVKPASPATCTPKEESPPDLYCVDANYNAVNAGQEDLDFVKMYWSGYNATTTVTFTTTTTTYQGQVRLPTTTVTTTTTTTTTVTTTTTTTTAGAGGRRLFLESSPVSQPYFNADDEAEMLIFGNEGRDEEVMLGEEARRLAVYGMADWTESYGYNDDVPRVAGEDGRSGKVDPWKFVASAANSAESAIMTLTGAWQRYDGSGYSVDYNLQYGNLTALNAAYRADMMALRERGWFTNRTRSMILTFALYSSSYDLWTQNDFILEMPVSTVVVPSKHINVYRPSYKEAAHHTLFFWVDNVRILFALYVLFVQVCCEKSYCKKREENWIFSYLITPLGLADLAIGCLTIWIYVVRHLLLGFLSNPKDDLAALINNDASFQSNSAKAFFYHQQLACEGPLFCCLLFRLLSFARINRNIFIIWTTLVEATKIYLPFCLGLIPVAYGLVVWAHSLWHNTLRQFTNIPVSSMSIIMAAHGDLNVDDMFHAHRPDRVIFGLILFVMTWLILINGWIAVLVHVYQTVRVRAGYRPSDYAWKEKHYVVWTLWRPLAMCYFKFLRRRIEKPKRFSDGDEDDDDK